MTEISVCLKERLRAAKLLISALGFPQTPSPAYSFTLHLEMSTDLTVDPSQNLFLRSFSLGVYLDVLRQECEVLSDHQYGSMESMVIPEGK